MAKTGIYISLLDTNIGSAQSDDSICMLVVDCDVLPTGAANQLENMTPVLLTSLSDAEGFGVTPEWAEGDGKNTYLYQHISEFYSQCATGTKLWIVPIKTTADKNFTTASLYSDLEDVLFKTIAGGYDNRPRKIGFCQAKTTLPAPTYNDDAVNNKNDMEAIAQIQAFCDSMFSLGIRLVAAYDGAYLKQGTCASATEIAKLTDASALDKPNVAYCITGKGGEGLASVGRLLGVCANRNIATSVGAVVEGSIETEDFFTDSALPNSGAVSTKGTLVNTMKSSLADIIAGLGYIFTRTRMGKTGLFYNDGATCNATTKALNKIERVAVGNAICDDAQKFLTDYINLGIPCDAKGVILSGFKSATIANFMSTYANPRINNGEASAISFDFNAKDGNYIQSEALEVTIKIVPVNAMREAFVQTFFVKSLN